MFGDFLNKSGRISDLDLRVFKLIREHVGELYARAGSEIGSDRAEVLEIAPQVWEGARPFIQVGPSVTTLDIDPHSNADIIGDICNLGDLIADSTFDFVICTEVLEHVSNPFSAITELLRILKPGGKLYASSPFDFRIHGPLPDNWRFSEHGWRELTKDFSKLEIFPLENPERFLMPLHYNIIAEK